MDCVCGRQTSDFHVALRRLTKGQDDQLMVLGLQFLEAIFQAFHPLFLFVLLIIWIVSEECTLIWLVINRQVLQRYLFLLGPTPILMKDLPGFDITKLGRRYVSYRSLFIQPLRHPVQGFISQILRKPATPAVEV